MRPELERAFKELGWMGAPIKTSTPLGNFIDRRYPEGRSQLAAELGISESSISRYCSAEKHSLNKGISALCEYLEIDVFALVERNEIVPIKAKKSSTNLIELAASLIGTDREAMAAGLLADLRRVAKKKR